MKTGTKNHKGAGRKPKYSEKTDLITFRCPESSICELKELVKQFLKNKEK